MPNPLNRAVSVARAVVEAATQPAVRKIDPAALPPIPDDHVRLTHNTSQMDPFQAGAPFRYGGGIIDSSTDSFTKNESVADWVNQGKRDSFGPLTMLMDMPIDDHNKRLWRFGWSGYKPVPNSNIIGHIDEAGKFVPLKVDTTNADQFSGRLYRESTESDYVRRLIRDMNDTIPDDYNPIPPPINYQRPPGDPDFF